MLTPTHLAIAMEYAAGGELFERICSAGRFSEDEVWLLQICNRLLLTRISSFRVLYRLGRRKGEQTCESLYFCYHHVSNIWGIQSNNPFSNFLFFFSGEILLPAAYIRC